LIAERSPGILSRLERSRLVSRDRNPDDARSFHFTLTSKGRAINRRRGSTIESAVRRALSRVSSHDVEAARRLLATVSDELHAIANSEVSRGVEARMEERPARRSWGSSTGAQAAQFHRMMPRRTAYNTIFRSTMNVVLP
jgi:ribosomal protein S20